MQEPYQLESLSAEVEKLVKMSPKVLGKENLSISRDCIAFRSFPAKCLIPQAGTDRASHFAMSVGVKETVSK